MSDSQASVAAGLRSSGIVVALGYLLGIARGPILLVGGALALITLSRSPVMDKGERLFSAMGLGLLVGTAGVGALRWGSLQIEDIRGAQAVLGPTVLVGPTGAAVASWLALLGALFALAVWLAPAEGEERRWKPWAILEGAAATLVVVSVFWGPELTPADGFGFVGGLLLWGLVSAVLLLVATALSGLLSRIDRVWTGIALGFSSIAVAACAVVVLST